MIERRGSLIRKFLEMMAEFGASDLHIISGLPPVYRINGELIRLNSEILSEDDCRMLIESLMDEDQKEKFYREKELDFSYSLSEKLRFRVNVYQQKKTIATSIRLIHMEALDIDGLMLPPVIKDFTRKTYGLVLVTGPTGCGKSTTLAAMVELINRERRVHIVTIEDPIEYYHSSKKSIISQREVGTDSPSFASALKYVLRQDPDVILVGEMRDLETIQAALTAAETGHLVFATLHTANAPQTIDRIIDVFPPYQQDQIRLQLSMTIEAIISQRLLLRADGKGRIPICEIMIGTPAIKNLIREGKTHQIYSLMETNRDIGMQTFSQSVRELLNKRLINQKEAQKVLKDEFFEV